MNERLTYTVEEAAALLGIGRNQAYEGVRSGEIPSVRIGRSYKIPKAQLDTLLKNGTNISKETRPTILRLRTEIAKREPTTVVVARIPVPLNNLLVESAIKNKNSMTQEVCQRLQKSFETEK